MRRRPLLLLLVVALLATATGVAAGFAVAANRTSERQASRELLAESSGPAEFYQDLLWALVNSKQFLFVH